jgi:predicted glycoside hydrolase/deacetylase ChbG (UPF0249 family)
MSTKRKAIQVVINADDYGYYNSVSAGIRDAISTGCVTATGIMANGDCLDRQLQALLLVEDVDVGIHLNLTYGCPMSPEMSKALSCWGGRFPGVLKMARAVATGRIDPEIVKNELIEQIESCKRKGIDILFVNSHEHIHMLPVIYKMTTLLAREYGIPFVRHTSAEWVGIPGAGAIARNMVIQTLGLMNTRQRTDADIRLIGLSQSGKINYSYLRKVFSALRLGNNYELMCHPGYFDPAEIRDQRLANYHNWETEFNLLTSNQMRDLCIEFNIDVVRYRDILAQRQLMQA